MGLNAPNYQLQFELDLPDDRQDGALSVEEIRIRSLTARNQLEEGKIWPNGQTPAWYDQYLNMLAGGWDWRVAVYIAWSAMPRPYRWPKTQMELAQKVLGLTSDRQIITWRLKNPAIQVMVRDVAAALVFEGLPEAFAAMAKVASTENYKGRGDRELMFKMAGILSDKTEIELSNKGADLSKLSWEEKLRLAGLDNPAALAEMKRKLAGESTSEEADSGQK